MNDPWDMLREDADIDNEMAMYKHRAFPDGLLDRYIQRQRRRHEAIQTYLESMLEAHPDSSNWKL